MTNADSTEQPAGNRRSVTLGGGREAISICVLMALSGDYPNLRLPLLLAAIVAAHYWVARTCFRFGRKTGIVATTVLLAVSGSVIGYQYLCYCANEEFLDKLSAYKSVKVRRAHVLPSAEITSVTFEDTLSDDDIAAIAPLPELANVTEVYLESTNATDASLSSLGAFRKLEYLRIHSSLITDEAIEKFDQRHSRCRIVTPGRPNL